MIDEKTNIRYSKYLSTVLRHNPKMLGIELDQNGWVDIDILIEKMNQKGFIIDLNILTNIIETNSKKRFAFNENRSKIRASQGHTIQVELNLIEKLPPQYLYHGTGQQSISGIFSRGIEKRKRQYVHLSSTIETALIVGKRHGVPNILQVAAMDMNKEGYSFYLSENNIWLVDFVPPKFIRLLS